MFNHTLVAGTFDHLHSGHQKLLDVASKHTRRLSCGITSPTLTTNKALSDLIQSSSRRSTRLISYLDSIYHFDGKAGIRPNCEAVGGLSIFSLTDPLFPAASSSQFDSIAVSTQTLPAVNQLNHLRRQNNLPQLTPLIIDLLQSTDHLPLSSTRIRQGQVNRQGYAYQQIFPSNRILSLPRSYRHHLKKPFGNIIQGSSQNLDWAGLQAKNIISHQKPSLVIAVGDIATLTLLNQNITLNLSLVDLKTKRLPLFRNLQHLGLSSKDSLKATNPAGSITPSLIQALQTSLSQSIAKDNLSQSILVSGEEDLAVLPTILLSPLNSLIFYGQPNQGLVYIKVTESAKQKALTLLQKFA